MRAASSESRTPAYLCRHRGGSSVNDGSRAGGVVGRFVYGGGSYGTKRRDLASGRRRRFSLDRARRVLPRRRPRGDHRHPGPAAAARDRLAPPRGGRGPGPGSVAPDDPAHHDQRRHRRPPHLPAPRVPRRGLAGRRLPRHPAAQGPRTGRPAPRLPRHRDPGRGRAREAIELLVRCSFCRLRPDRVSDPVALPAEPHEVLAAPRIDAHWEAFMAATFGDWRTDAEVASVLPHVRAEVLGQMHGQGLGRHSASEVWELGRADIRALAGLLGATSPSISASSRRRLMPRFTPSSSTSSPAPATPSPTRSARRPRSSATASGCGPG
jgi:hypothetical protein